MRCEQIMKKDLECISPTEDVKSAASKMRDGNVGFLPVCGEDEKVLGTITDRDLAIRVLAEGRDGATPIQDVMSRQVVACKPGDELRVAEDLMAREHKSRIMCIDDAGKLVGVISLSDLAQRDGLQASRTLERVSEREARA